jgi:hypothetical protein
MWYRGQGPMYYIPCQVCSFKGWAFSEHVHTKDNKDTLLSPSPAMIASTSHVLSHLVLSIISGSRSYYYPHLTNQETEGERRCLPRITNSVNIKNRIRAQTVSLQTPHSLTASLCHPFALNLCLNHKNHNKQRNYFWGGFC